MFEIAIVYLIVSLSGFFGVFVSVARLVAAQNAESRKRAGLSLLGAVVILMICGTTIYVSLYETFPWWAVVLTSVFFLVLNHHIFGRYSKT